MDIKAGDCVKASFKKSLRVVGVEADRLIMENGNVYYKSSYDFEVVSPPTPEEPEPGTIWEYVPTGNYFARLGNGKWIGLYGGSAIQWENFIQAFRDNKMRRVK